MNENRIQCDVAAKVNQFVCVFVARQLNCDAIYDGCIKIVASPLRFFAKWIQITSIATCVTLSEN